MSRRSRRNKKQHSASPSSRRRDYYWVQGMVMDRRGNLKEALLGAHDSYDEAERVGYEKMTGDFKVHKLNTINVSIASQKIKAKKVYEENMGVGDALTPLRHRGEDIGIE